MFRSSLVVRILVFLGAFIFLLANSYSANESLYLDSQGSCAGFTVEFTLYNLTEWEIRDEIEDNGDREFTNISNAEITIYNGPFKSSPIFAEFTGNERGTFNYTFPIANSYLINIEESDDFEELEQIVFINPCEAANEEVGNNNYNETFFYEDKGTTFTLDFINVNSQTQEDLIVNTIDDGGAFPEINNSLFYFTITRVEDVFDYESLNFSLRRNDFEENDKLQLYKLEGTSWQTTDFSISGSEITIIDIEYGTYVLTKEIDEDILLDTGEDTLNDGNLTSNLTPEEEDNLTEIVTQQELEAEKSKFPIGLIIFGILGVTILIFIIYMFTAKKKSKVSDEEKKFFEEKNVETIHSYTQEYESTKNYVKQYKASYEKEQIRKALKAANVSDDIIEKVFNEEFIS